MPDSTDRIRAAFVARLDCIRGEMTPVEFDKLVDDIVATAHRLNDIDTRGLGTRNPSTRHTNGVERVEQRLTLYGGSRPVR